MLATFDRKGRDLTRLTNNLDSEECPRWAPCKGGVEVAVESIVIPDLHLIPVFDPSGGRKYAQRRTWSWQESS